MKNIYKILCLIITVIVLVTCFVGCAPRKTTVPITCFAYENNTANNLVYVREGDTYTPFIILTTYYSGNKTLLLRKDALPTPQRFNEYNSAYENSEIDTYLNSEYLSTLTDIKFEIPFSSIVVTDKNSLGVSGSKTKSINRQVFLLSCTECGIDAPNVTIEGFQLSYFNDKENRAALCEGRACNWWLRSPNTCLASTAYVVTYDNKIAHTNTYSTNSIRPAFCVSSTSELELNHDIIPGSAVYIFSK